MTPSTPLPLARYVRLYTLHQIETPITDLDQLFVLRVRIETLRYSFQPLLPLPSAPPYPRPVKVGIDEIYAYDPREGVQIMRDTVRDAVLPRLHTLLEARDPFAELALTGDRAALWQRYATQRGLPAQPVEIPGIAMPEPRPQLPARSQTSERLAKVQRALDTLHTAAQTAQTLLAMWQNWQIGQAQRQLIDTQRDLLHHAIQAQLAGQDQALDRALNGDFVRGYLADHADDAAHDAVFGE
ncbi:MAG: hypothetical protein JXA10_17045 [Anaerolineae bacterium]|nr:hypothetical protein [Anaerolineae bacterium]